MFGSTFLTAPSRFERPRGRASSVVVATGSRRIALLRSGRRFGPITRLITPWDIGELTQPFVFLGYTEHEPGARIVVGAQPGIATLTLVLSGALVFEDVHGLKGTVLAGGFKWATPGEVVRYAADRATGEPPRDFQLWVELPSKAASASGESRCVAPHEVEEEGPVRVVLGQLGRACSPLAHAPLDINYFHVRLKDGHCWRYAAPAAHNITWIAVNRGAVRIPADGRVLRQQIALFGDSGGVIEVQADGESSFVLGSARRVSNALAQGLRYPIDMTCAPCAPREGTKRRLSTGGSRLANGNDALHRVSCRSNL
jgi:redox-sensitive bicupin YhaK (pirin superfamily)